MAADTTALEFCVDEIGDVVAEISTATLELAAYDHEDRNDLIDRVDERTQRLYKLIRGFKTEIKELPPEERSVWFSQASDFESKASGLERKVQAAKRMQVMGAAGIRQRNEDTSTPSGMIRKAQRMQEESKEALRHSKKLVATSREVGQATFESLQNQSEELNKIHTNIKGLEEKLQDADSELTGINKRMIGNKIACGLIVLICLCLAFICAWLGSNGLPQDDGDTAALE